MNTATTATGPSNNAAHLRRLLEVQPACLMRVDVESRFRAVNAAALRLLDATDLSHVLHRSLTDWLAASQHDDWRAFVARAALAAGRVNRMWLA